MAFVRNPARVSLILHDSVTADFDFLENRHFLFILFFVLTKNAFSFVIVFHYSFDS